MPTTGKYDSYSFARGLSIKRGGSATASRGAPHRISYAFRRLVRSETDLRYQLKPFRRWYYSPAIWQNNLGQKKILKSRVATPLLLTIGCCILGHLFSALQNLRGVNRIQFAGDTITLNLDVVTTLQVDPIFGTGA